MNILNPGEVAVTAGTSGVIYAISDKLKSKEPLRINNFAHINYSKENNILGKLLCINGVGIKYRWLKNILNVDSYQKMNHLASEIEIGSEGDLYVSGITESNLNGQIGNGGTDSFLMKF